jgi:hypothetical protein
MSGDLIAFTEKLYIKLNQTTPVVNCNILEFMHRGLKTCVRTEKNAPSVLNLGTM